MALVVLAGISAQAQRISGDYLETRNADVWTSACVANGEVNLAGDQAILAWRVNQGEWNGVSLDGLGVIGVVKTAATMGDEYSNPYPAKAVMIVDAKASMDQRKALVSFAQQMTGELLKNVVEIKVAPFEMKLAHHAHDGKASLRAGNLVRLETRGVSDKDHLCGNEGVYYQPLATLVHSMPAVAEVDQYEGTGLGVIWTLHGKRSAFVGNFAL
ncbi:MAG TPA: DUF1326 domain-containing protein [Pyrinomonadaceae bacterium]|nr:DUF1326 domain-containing protein [Pyrinomonadaceae bacterium]